MASLSLSYCSNPYTTILYNFFNLAKACYIYFYIPSLFSINIYFTLLFFYKQSTNLLMVWTAIPFRYSLYSESTHLNLSKLWNNSALTEVKLISRVQREELLSEHKNLTKWPCWILTPDKIKVWKLDKLFLQFERMDHMSPSKLVQEMSRYSRGFAFLEFR